MIRRMQDEKLVSGGSRCDEKRTIDPMLTTLRATAGSALRWVQRVSAAASRRVGPRLPAIAAVALVTALGAILGAKLAPAAQASVGPLQVQVRVTLTLHPGVRLLLPPAGEVRFTTHRAPFGVEASISRVDLEDARRLIDSPSGVRLLGDQAVPALRSAAIKAALITLACGLFGALALSLLVFRTRWRRTASVAATLTGALVVTSGMAYATADPTRLAQPQFTGLLSQAPYIAGQVPNVLARLESYRTGLADIIRSVTALYATAGRLPSSGAGADVITVLHVSDIHLNPLAYDLIGRLVTQFDVDVVVDTGDITTWGTEVEGSTLSRIRNLKVPYVFVRGNHDSVRTAAAVAQNDNAIVLANSVVTVAGVTIAGIGDPKFTPDSAEDVAAATGAAATTSSAPTNTGLRQDLVPRAAATVGPEGRVNSQLATTIDYWDAAHPGLPVEIAAIHEPVEMTPLLGRVNTIFAGHLHSRSTRLDPSGTRIMIEGSTGGAGITARGLGRLANGQPLPLAASLVYIARTGPQAGRVVATDSITVGGFGLSSVNLQRTVIQDQKPLVPPGQPSSTASPTATSSP